FALGWVSPPYKLAALSIAAVACTAIANGGTTSQDLKTGYLIGATPSRQQIAILVGSLSSALVLGFVILKLNDAGTVFAARSYPNVTFSQSDYTGTRERLRGPDAGRDANTYNVVWLRERGVPAALHLDADHAGRNRALRGGQDGEAAGERRGGGERARRALLLGPDRGGERDRYHPRVPAAERADAELPQLDQRERED